MTSSYRPEYTRLRDEHRYAVARLDLRGTGSSGGRATDEYPRAGAARPRRGASRGSRRSPGATATSGCTARPTAASTRCRWRASGRRELKAVIAIYATDDRYTDDVHYMGGLRTLARPRRLLPLHDADERAAARAGGLRPQVARRVARAHRRARAVAAHLAEPPAATTRTGGTARCVPGYDRIEVPTMIVAGWADGYRNNTFRTMEALGENGVPRRLLAGPWSHASTATSLPGPRIDLVPEMVRWWDRWLRGIENGVDAEPEAVWYSRGRRTGPRPTSTSCRATWRADSGPSTAVVVGGAPARRRSCPTPCKPDVGTAAWISCAGHLPYGPAARPAPRRRRLAHVGRRSGGPRDRRQRAGAAVGSRRRRPSRPSRSSSTTSRRTARRRW